MGLKEKLENLRLEEERKKELERAAEEQRRKSLAEQEERIRAGLEQLEEIAKKELQPLLELVNDAYLGGRGKVGELEKCDGRFIDCRSIKHWVNLSLSWDSCETIDGAEGESLKIRLDDNKVATIRGSGSRSPRELVGIDDKDVKQKLEESVYKILTTPRACTWSRRDPEYCSR